MKRGNSGEGEGLEAVGCAAQARERGRAEINYAIGVCECVR